MAWVQMSMAYLQRAANRQPGGGLRRLGTVPGDRFQPRLAGHRAVDARDRADQALRIGMARIGEQRLDRRLLDDLAGIHHGHPLAGLGDHAHGMGDQHDRHAEALLHLVHQLEDLRLDGDVERRGRLVGDQELGLAGERHGDHDALAHAAGELVRIVVHAPLRVGDVDQPQHLGGAHHRLLGRQLLVQGDHLGDLVAHRVDRVERGHRLLEDDGDLAGADLVHLVLVERDQVPALPQDLAGLEAARRHVDQLQDRARRHGLAAARFAHHAHGLAAVDVQVDAIDRTHHSVFGLEPGFQAANVQQGICTLTLAPTARGADRRRRAARRR